MAAELQLPDGSITQLRSSSWTSLPEYQTLTAASSRLRCLKIILLWLRTASAILMLWAFSMDTLHVTLHNSIGGSSSIASVDSHRRLLWLAVINGRRLSTHAKPLSRNNSLTAFFRANRSTIYAVTTHTLDGTNQSHPGHCGTQNRSIAILSTLSQSLSMPKTKASV